MAGRVLVLETDEAQVDQLDRLLGSRGLEVEALSSGEQGVARAEQRLPVLVVSALELPDAQGFGLCRRLKRHPVLKDVPLFLLGRASERAAMEEHSRLRGRAEGYFVKPFSGEAFWAHASRWIEQGASAGAPAAWVERGARVLLVDAQRGAVEPLKAALEGGGCAVEVAEGGGAGVGLGPSAPPRAGRGERGAVRPQRLLAVSEDAPPPQPAGRACVLDLGAGQPRALAGAQPAS